MTSSLQVAHATEGGIKLERHKENIPMNYRKPEVKALGNAGSVIEFLAKPMGQSMDGAVHPTVYDAPPAYDLDE
jgi:hypothetical protein